MHTHIFHTSPRRQLLDVVCIGVHALLVIVCVVKERLIVWLLIASIVNGCKRQRALPANQLDNRGNSPYIL